MWVHASLVVRTCIAHCFLLILLCCASHDVFIFPALGHSGTCTIRDFYSPRLKHRFFAAQVTIDQVIGGARGIKSMIWETSNLDADEVSLIRVGGVRSGCATIARIHTARVSMVGAGTHVCKLL